jgi:hypothetical protein
MPAVAVDAAEEAGWVRSSRGAWSHVVGLKHTKDLQARTTHTQTHRHRHRDTRRYTDTDTHRHTDTDTDTDTDRHTETHRQRIQLALVHSRHRHPDTDEKRRQRAGEPCRPSCTEGPAHPLLVPAVSGTTDRRTIRTLPGGKGEVCGVDCFTQQPVVQASLAAPMSRQTQLASQGQGLSQPPLRVDGKQRRARNVVTSLASFAAPPERSRRSTRRFPEQETRPAKPPHHSLLIHPAERKESPTRNASRGARRRRQRKIRKEGRKKKNQRNNDGFFRADCLSACSDFASVCLSDRLSPLPVCLHVSVGKLAHSAPGTRAGRASRVQVTHFLIRARGMKRQ